MQRSARKERMDDSLRYYRQIDVLVYKLYELTEVEEIHRYSRHHI